MASGLPGMGPSPISAAMLSGAIKARPGRTKSPKAPTGVKAAPARPGLMPTRQAMGGMPKC